MPRREDRSDTALVLAELLDAALAEHCEHDQPVVAVLCQTGGDDDDLRLAPLADARVPGLVQREAVTLSGEPYDQCRARGIGQLGA